MMVADILGPDALIVLVLAVVLLFGANRIPLIARSLGEAAKELKRSQADRDDGSPPASSDGADDSTVTLSRAELDALIAEHEARARAGQEGSSPPRPS